MAVEDGACRRRAIAPESLPARIQGFITALPVQWTSQESNDTQFALAMLANNELEESKEKDTQLAAAEEAMRWKCHPGKSPYTIGGQDPVVFKLG